MASKIVVFVLVVTVYQVQSRTIYYSNPQSSPASTSSSNAKASAAASPSSSNAQASSNSQASTSPQSQTFTVQPSNPNQGIKASPQLQIIPGQGCNLQAIPVSQIRGPIQQRGQNQNVGCSIPRPVQQASPGSVPSQIQTSPANLIQPCITGPASVITSPVSTITIPPSGCTTIIDNSLSNTLANALQMMIATGLIKEGVQIPVVETVVPNFDSSSSCQKECDQPQIDTHIPKQYDWTAIQNFLNQQGQPEKPTTEAAPTTDASSLIGYLQQYGQTAEQISQAANSQQASPQQATNIQSSPQQTTDSQYIPYPSDQNAYNGGLEALAAYFGCNVSDLSSNTFPAMPPIVLPEEIPAQLICNYGYMPTAVPVVSFSVQPLACGGDSNNFIVGCQC